VVRLLPRLAHPWSLATERQPLSLNKLPVWIREPDELQYEQRKATNKYENNKD